MNFLDALESMDAEQKKMALKSRFVKNVAFFENKNPTYAAILRGRPREYGIVVDNGGVNIANIHSGALVYQCVDGRHTMIDVAVTIAKNPLSHTKWDIGFGHNPFYMLYSKLYLTEEACKAALHFVAQKTGGDVGLKPFGKALPSAFLYGLGGGAILEAMRSEYDGVDTYFIYEPIDDFFVISAYFVDYEALYKTSANIFLAVGEAPTTEEIKDFFALSRIVALFPRLEMTLFDAPEIARLKDVISIEADTAFRGFGSYEDEMIGWRNSLSNTGFTEKLKYPTLTKIKKKLDIPICIVANGASLDANIEFLRKNQENMIIFSAGTTLRALMKNNIRPDFQIEIERIDYLAPILTEAGIGDIDLICANVVDPATIKSTNGERFVFFRDYTSSATLNAPKNMIFYASPLVGNAALSLAISFSKTVIICGMDVGYKSGKTHSKDSIYEKDASLPPDSVRVTANFEESEIYSNSFYNLSKFAAEKAIAKSEKTTIFNVSDGAYIHGAKPVRAENIVFDKKINKKVATQKIKSFFSQRYGDVFAKKGMETIYKEVELLKKDLLNSLFESVRSKADVFKIVRELETTLDFHEHTNKTAYLLFGTSMRHIIFSIYTACLCLEDEYIQEFYTFAANEAHEGLQKLISDFRAQNSKLKVSNLISQVKVD